MRFWKRTNPDSTTRIVESYSHDLDVKGAIEITKLEFNSFIASLPTPEPERDLVAEIDEIETRIKKLEDKIATTG